MAVEEPKFQIVQAQGDFEVRDYPSLVVAEVEVEGDHQTASSRGFGLLAKYIFGGNAGNNKIAMTAPVLQTQVGMQGSESDMITSARVAGHGGNWKVQFTMPSEFSLADLPEPNDKRVHLKSISPTRMAVLVFSGLTSERRVRSKTDRLHKLLGDHNLIATGPLRLARYNPPWTPWFMRRNELMVQIAWLGEAPG